MNTNPCIARRSRLTSALACVAVLAALAGSAQIAVSKEKLVPSGTITINQTRVALIVSGSGGGGTLTFHGRRYPFSIGGLGIGGIGVSKLNAVGTVYNMTDISQFAGTYGQARTGYTAGDTGKDKLWLEKTGDSNVVIRLNARSKGLALSLGGDLVNINLK